MLCNNSKYNCGIIVPSSCVPFTGKKLTFITPEEQQNFDCDANINDVILLADKYLKKLVDGNNLTTLNVDCLTTVNPLTITPAQLHQVEVTEICLLKGQVKTLSDQLNDLNIGNEVVEITLPECLQEDIAPCAVGPSQYQLISLLILYANKICELETRISNLES